jgi:hypothetical protein
MPAIGGGISVVALDPNLVFAEACDALDKVWLMPNYDDMPDSGPEPAQTQERVARL